MSSSSTLGAAASTFVCARGACARPSRKALAPALLLLLAACAPAPARVPAASAGAAGYAGVTARAPASAVRVGVETFLADVPRALRGKRVGLITNHTGIDRARTSDIDLIARHKELKLVAMLAPEQGIGGTAEAGEQVVDETERRAGGPVDSPY